jgi:hypothetical protein
MPIVIALILVAVYLLVYRLLLKSVRPDGLRQLITLSALVGIYFLIDYLFTDVVPRDAMTEAAVQITEQRIKEYVSEHHKLPRNLSDLPPVPPDRYSDINDAWGRELIYTPQPDGSVVLGSHGKDGTGDDKFTVRFTVPEPIMGGATTTPTVN